MSALPSDFDPKSQPPNLLSTDEEQAVNNELFSKDPFLSQLYLGVKHALSQTQNPDYLRHAAVSMRELIICLPKRDSRVPKSDRVRMQKDMLNALEDKFKAVVSIKESLESLGPSGAAVIQTFLDGSKDFFEKRESAKERKRAQLQVYVEVLDPMFIWLPENKKKLIISGWMKLDDYFNAVTHRPEADKEEFLEMVRKFESAYIAQSNPPTRKKIAEIDQLIEEIESE